MILFSNGLLDFRLGKNAFWYYLFLKVFVYFLISVLQIKVQQSQCLVSWTAVPLVQVHRPLQLLAACLVVPPHPPVCLRLPLCLDRPAVLWAALPLGTLPNPVHLSLCCFLERANQQPRRARAQLSPHLSLVWVPAAVTLPPLVSALELPPHRALQVHLKKKRHVSLNGFHCKQMNSWQIIPQKSMAAFRSSLPRVLWLFTMWNDVHFVYSVSNSWKQYF